MKKYLLFGLLSLMLIVTGCGAKNTVNGANESNETVTENNDFNTKVDEWFNKLSYMSTEYGEGYKVENNPYKDNTDKVEGINLMRSDWDSFNSEMNWNPETTKDKQILEAIDKVTYDFKMAMEYKSNYFNTKNSSDLSMMREYEQDFKNDLTYFGTLTGY